MLRSMFSAISGLRSHQTMMDVTGNNIANVNTTGFKASQTIFQDLLSQVLQGAGAPAGGGGTNPAQVGLGMRLAGTTTNFTQGAAQEWASSASFPPEDSTTMRAPATARLIGPSTLSRSTSVAWSMPGPPIRLLQPMAPWGLSCTRKASNGDITAPADFFSAATVAAG